MAKGQRASYSGEQAAIGGYLRQYEYSAAVLHRSMQDGAFESLCLCEPEAGIFDDLVVLSETHVKAIQIKSRRNARYVSLKTEFTADLVKSMGRAWQGLSDKFNRNVRLTYIFAGLFNRRDTGLAIEGSTGARHSAEFARFLSGDNLTAEMVGSSIWSGTVENLKRGSGLDEADFLEFLVGLSIEDERSLYSNSIKSFQPGERDKVEAIMNLLPRLVACTEPGTEWTKQDLMRELDMFPVSADDKDNNVTLSLDRKPRHDVDVGQPFINMRFEQRGTEFVGRTTELRKLQDFLESEKRLAWWQVSGAGGQGKSRLGLRLIDMIGSEWHAGFLGTRGLDRDWNRVDFNRPTLIIVDYLAAPGKARKFVEAIEALARRVPGADGQVTPDARPIKQPVRFLVLERAGFDDDAHTSDGAASWYGMIRQGAVPAMTATRHARHSLELQDLSREEMIAIANSWRAGPGRELPPLSDTQTGKLVNLMGKSGHSGRQKAWRPLFAMMLGERIDRFDTTLNADDAIEDILYDALKAEREEVWPKDDNGQPAALSPQALNLACLTSMIGIYDHRNHAETLESAAPDKAAFGEFYGAFDTCHLNQTNTALGYHVQPLGRKGVAPLVARQPDLLAEYQVLLELGAEPMLQGHPTRLARLTEDAFRLAPSDLTAFFVRLAEDFPKHATARALFEAQLPADALSMHSDRQDQTQFADDLDANLPSYFGLVGLMRAYLSKGADISKQTSNGAFPLLLAAQEGHAGVVADLIEAGANVDAVDSKSGAFPLLLAAQNGHAGIVAALVKAGANVDAVNSKSGTFPLLLAAQEGHAGVVADLIEAKAKVDAVNSENGTFPLLLAAQNGHAGIVAALVKAGANVDAVNSKSGTFPLLQAAQEGHAGIVAALVKAGANVDAVNSKSGTFPLLQAAQEGHAGIVAELIEAGANVDAENSENGTFPLLMAARNGHAGIVAALAKAGADPRRAHEETGLKALDLAVMAGNGALIEILTDALGRAC